MNRFGLWICVWTVAFWGLASGAEDTTGLLEHTSGASPGYNLFSPLDGAGSYLMDNEGRVVHTWESPYRSNISYLLDNGNLMRTTTFGNGGNGHFFGGGAGHGIEELTWDGERVWEFTYSSEDYLMHHDIEPMPNGNVLAIAWERRTVEEALAAGREPDQLGDDGLWPLHIIEVAPTRPKGGDIVWEWHAWDHLIQDFDPEKANYGDVAAHPERIEINPPGLWMDRISDEELAELESLGYLGGDPNARKKSRRQRNRSADWLHTNAIAYNAELDQIAVSALGNNEIWIIDHSTTTEEAKGSTGGRYGKGGDLLYRWGNPAAYRAGGDLEQTLFAQHDIQWVPASYPGGGNLLAFNNGRGRPEGAYSTVVEWTAPQTAPGHYTVKPGTPFAPAAPDWEYKAPEPKDFYSMFISGAQRQPNGTTLICSGAQGMFFEVTPAGDIVWKYVSPVKGPEGSSHSNPNAKPTNAVFRMHRYGTDHPAFQGKTLTPGPLLSDYVKEHPPAMPLTLDAWRESAAGR